MTVTMGVALTLPFTFSMHPAVGILLLLGVYKGGVYGGSITAILIKTPGTPGRLVHGTRRLPNVAQWGGTQGARHRALCIVLRGFHLEHLTHSVRRAARVAFALRFGPPEYFTLVVFSLTIIAGIAGDNMAKGMVSAGLGLLLATIGLDLVYGTNRMVFGEVELMAGLNFIPVLIGLFATARDHQLLRQAVRRAWPDSGAGRRHTRRLRSSSSCFKSILRGSIIGVVLGAIPGIGGAPSAFLSYSEARRTSKDPRTKFGKGRDRGRRRFRGGQQRHSAAPP